MNRIIQSGYYKLTRRIFFSGLKRNFLLCVAVFTLTILFLSGSVSEINFTYPYESLITLAGIRYLFLAALFFCVFTMAAQIYFDSYKNKGFYTLMMLPMPRCHVFLAYCTTGVIYALMLWTVQALSLLAAYGPVVSACGSAASAYAQSNGISLPFEVARTNGLFLAIIRGDLFRILLPQSIPGLLSSVFALFAAGSLPACSLLGNFRSAHKAGGFMFLIFAIVDVLWAIGCRFGIVTSGVDITAFVISTALMILIVIVGVFQSIRQLNKSAILT